MNASRSTPLRARRMLARNTAAARDAPQRLQKPKAVGARGSVHTPGAFGLASSADTGDAVPAARVLDPARGTSNSVVPLREMPRISVVVPTYCRPELLRRCLHALLVQSLDAEAFEIVVVDDGHDEETRTLVEALGAHTRAPCLRYVRPASGRGPAVARNAGWRAAWAPLIAFTDDDTLPAPDWLRCGSATFEQSEAPEQPAAVCGRLVVPAREGMGGALPSDHELMTRGLERAEFVTANVFVRKSALVAIGGFDERFLRAWREDSDLQLRLIEAGGVIARCEEAVVVHPVRPERWGVSLRQQKNAYFDALLYKKHPRAYRERIQRVPPWDYYAIVLLSACAPPLYWAEQWLAGTLALGVGAALIGRFALGRLRRTSHAPSHVAEMLATSVLIPFLSVYWRLVGALRFRSFFL